MIFVIPYFTNDGVKIYYEIEGEGPPVVMIHGFSSNLEGNWKDTNWIETLKDNYRLILLDCRGHGKSDKPHDKASYGSIMVVDIIKLMKHLSIERANLFGYSMGSEITLWLLLTKPEIIISAILGGYVITLDDKQISRNIELHKLMIEAFKADSIDQIKKPMARAYRQYAETGGNDLLALAALIASLQNHELTEIFTSPAQMRKSLKKIKVPVMTVVGSTEVLLGDKTLIAQLIPDACHFQIQGKDHRTVVRDPKFHMVVKAFLNYVNRK